MRNPLQGETETIDSPATPSGNGAAGVPRAGAVAVPPSADGGTGGIAASLTPLRRHPDLALLAALLLLTATLSRSFSQAITIGPVYVTELVMALTAAIAVARLGLGRSWWMLRRLPLWALAVIWFVGTIATIRGLEEFGLSMVTHDVGLLDYTLLLPLLALLVVDRERHEALFSVLVACGFAGIAAFVAVFTADQISGHANTLFALQGSAAGLYMSFAVVWIAARLVNGVPTARWMPALIPIGLVLMGLTGQRSVWMVAILSLGAVVLLAPRESRRRSALALALVLPLSLGAAIGIQSVLATVVPAEATSAATAEATSAATAAETAVSPIDLGNAETRGSQNLSTTSDDGGPQLTEDLSGLTNFDSDEGQNVSWRLAYWKELVSRVPSDPILGAGFGRPAAFTWRGRKYDFRDGDPLTGIDVAGPHNSFVNFLWRLGIPATLALLFVLGVAAARVRAALRDGLAGDDRVALATLVGMLAAGTMASSFNEGLVGPFLGLYFWVPLGMLLLWPGTRSPDAPPASAASRPSTPAGGHARPDP